MAKQKITVESRLRTENTMLKEQLRAGQLAYRDLSEDLQMTKQEVAADAGTISTLRRDLGETRRQLTLCQEQLRDLQIAVRVQARVVSAELRKGEDLRYLVHNQARPE